MKTKCVVILLAAMLMFSGATLLANVKGASWPNLPLTTVQLTVVDGTISYFDSTLSGVPAGFDVTNGMYLGWCVDRTVTMLRGTPHDVMLYSSISPPVLTSINWIAINYILNHKQGVMMDVQNAIWHYTDNYTPPGGYSAASQAMIDAADANPSYDPMTGTVLAIICFSADNSDAQNSIIELQIPSLEPGYTPGFWKHNIGVALGYNKGDYSAFRDGTKLTLEMLEGYAATVGVTLQEAYDALSEKGNTAGQAQIRADMANAFNAAAGFGPFLDE